MTPWQLNNPARMAVSASGFELAAAALAWIGKDYRPEPDVLVMVADFEPRQRFVERRLHGEKEPWIAIKRRLYLAHPPCEAAILIDPYRVEVRTDPRMGHPRMGYGWKSGRLTRLDEWLTIPAGGLHCPVGAVYGRTLLNRRQLR